MDKKQLLGNRLWGLALGLFMGLVCPVEVARVIVVPALVMVLYFIGFGDTHFRRHNG